MNIIVHEESKQFHLCNDYISYVMYVQPNGELGQLYFGKKIHDREDFSHLVNCCLMAVTPYYDESTFFSLEKNRQEYPSFGTGDFGTPAFKIIDQNGSGVSCFKYVTYSISSVKKKLPGLPATYADEGEALSLEIELKDDVNDMQLFLTYSIFKDYPVITRSARFVNGGAEEAVLDKALSLCLDLPDSDYEWIQFSGAWARERNVITKKLDKGITAVESRRGHSGANENPFVIIKRPNTDETNGEAMGFSLLYSGNFIMQAESDADGKLRILSGIHPDTFSWILKSGESFVTPESVITWSDKGLNGLSQTIHSLYNNHLVRGKWKNSERPILLNNWEATYMDFTEESILKIASKAKEAGAELFVLDDGWFGKRNDDNSSLGDWFVNTDKLKQGLKGVSASAHKRGLKFGLWFEPEMVNEDSDLYRAHPDWALADPDRKPMLARNQLVLDMSRQDVVDYLFDAMCAVLDHAKIEYVKWDFNRSISNCYSHALSADRQGEVAHRFMLGTYQLLDRLLKRYPDLMIEGCSGGGGRFDAGMLYYCPQIWCSDDSDAVERLEIQRGTSYGYPASTMGAHVSASPNHQTGRMTPLSTRSIIAQSGTFGYELNPEKLTDAEKEEIKKQISDYHRFELLIAEGSYYRLTELDENKDFEAWMFVSPDQKEALVNLVMTHVRANGPFPHIRLQGLNPQYHYRVEGENIAHSGLALVNGGFAFPQMHRDYPAAQLHLVAIE